MCKRLLLLAALAVLSIAFGGAGKAVLAESQGSISGVVYFDDDVDGQRDPNEKPAPNRTVELMNTDGQSVDSDVSDRNGEYRLTGILPGIQYWVELRSDGDTPCYAVGFEYPPSDDGTFNSDFGVLAKGTGSIFGRIVEDRDEDGVVDPDESGSEGWDVGLSMRSDNAWMYCDLHDVTDYAGNYGFTDLPLLAYDVAYWPETSISPFVATSPLDRDSPSSGLHYPLVDLRDKPEATNVDILVHFVDGTSEVRGVAFRDLNLNTVRDEGEPILNCAVYGNMIVAYRETPVGKLSLNNVMVNCQDAEFTLSGVSAGTYDVELSTWCAGPNAPPPAGPGPSRSVTVSENERSSPVELGMCPQAQAWFPVPVTPTPTPTPGPIIIPPPLGSGTTDTGGTASTDGLPWIAAAIALAVIGSTGAGYALSRLRRRS